MIPDVQDLKRELSGSSEYLTQAWSEAEKNYQELVREMKKKIRTKTPIDGLLLRDYVNARELVMFLENESLDIDRRIKEIR